MVVLKICTVCKMVKPYDQYGSHKRTLNSLNPQCKDCVNVRSAADYQKSIDVRRKQHKEYYENHKQESRARSEKRNILKHDDIKHWYKENHKKYKQLHAAKARFRIYGLTEDDYRKMLEEQKNKCLICESDFTAKGPQIDHCHKTGKVRGILCSLCNTAIGKLKDSVEIITRAAKYVETEGDIRHEWLF
jgi:hypothetical protein